MSRLMQIITGAVGIVNLFLMTTAVALWMNYFFEEDE